MTYEPPTLPPAGWYPDPERPGHQRWWNGSSWAPAWPVPGPNDRYPDLGEMLGRAFTRAIRHWRSLVVLALVTSVPSSILVGLAMRLLLADVVVDDDITGWDNSRIAPGAGLVLVAVVTGLIGYLATVWLMLHAVDRDRGQDPRSASTHAPVTTESELALVRQALVGAVRCAGRAAGWSLVFIVAVAVAMLAVVLPAVVVGPAMLVLFLVVAPVLAWLTIRFAFFVQAIVDRPGNPFTRSAEVVAGRWWPTLGRILIVGIITALIGFAVNSATSVASGNGFGNQFGEQPGIELAPDGSFERFDLETVAPSATAMVLGVFGTLAGAVFTSGVTAAALAELYRTRQRADR